MSNLLDKASIILTPTAYNNGEALCVKPSDGSGDFDFSRNSAATRVNAQGLVENVQILSSNLVQNGDFSEEGVQEVSNGSFSQEGAELVTNGDFSVDGIVNSSSYTLGWYSADSGISISAGKLIITNGGSVGGRAYGTNGVNSISFITSGKSYKLVYTIEENNDNALVSYHNGGSYVTAPNTVGTHTIYYKAGGTIFILRNNSTNSTIKIDNVSVKEVGQDWTLGSGWSIGEDKATSDGTTENLDQDALTIGKSYKAQFTVSDLTTGTLSFRLGGTNEVININSNGTYTVYGVANGVTLRLRSQSGFDGSVTNISVKEVGQNWDVVNGTITDKYNASLTSYQSGIRINSFIKTGTFKVTFDLVVTSGSCKFVAGGSNEQIYSTSGTKEIIVINPSRFEFNAFNLGWVGTLDNVSVIQVTSDTNLPRINYENFSYQDALGSELVVNGGFDSDTTWLKQPDWTISNGTANCDGNSSANYIYQSLGITLINKTYKITYTISNFVSGSVAVGFGGGLTNPIGTYRNANGTYTEYLTPTSTSQLFGLRSSFFIGSIDNVSVKEYLGQEVVPNSGCGSWLFEPQSTNLITQSNDFSQWIDDTDTSITSNAIISPDGTQNADKLIAGNSVARQAIKFNLTVSGDIVMSVFAKKGEYSVLQFSDARDPSLYANFDIENGTIGSSNIIVSSIQDYGNGWYRCVGVYNSLNDIISFRISIAENSTDGRLINFSGNNSDGLYIWGAMLEQNSFSTSYIPTSGSTVTRNQDVCINGGSLATINSTEGVLYAEIAALSDDGTNRRMSMSDGTSNNRIVLGFSTTTNQIIYIVVVNGVTVANGSYNTTDTTQFHKIAIKYKENDFALWANGVQINTDTSGITFPTNTLNVLQFTDGNGQGNKFFSKTKAVAVWKEALSDSELQSLTTI